MAPSCQTATVPWCATCDRFLNPPTVRVDGACPECGDAVSRQETSALVAREETLEPGSPEAESFNDAPPKMPWHLKLVLGALALYLGYRCVELVEWVVGRAL
ncbi:MAG: hypothetical protein ACOYN3_07755 [Acidimicrobiia bacterium]